MRERKEIGFPFGPRQREDKAQGGVYGPGHAAMGRRGPLASKPYHFLIFLKIFHLSNFEI
jgi:hypothetical protein